MRIKNNKKILISLGIIAIVLSGGVGYIGAINGWWGGGGSIPSDTFTRGLVGYWSMDEGSGTTAYDGSGNSNTGTLTNSPKWAAGKVGGALQFDGVDDYVDVPTSVVPYGTGATFTVSAWFKADSVTGTRAILEAKPNYTCSLYANYGTTIVVFVNREGGDPPYASVNTGVTAVLGQWYMLTAVWNGSQLEAFLNGVSKGTSSTGTGNPNSNTGLNIGRRRDNAGYFNGLIDDVRIYNRALSAEEIRYHYNRGGPVGQWTMDEGSGKTAFDSSENNNSGHIFGPALSFSTNDYVDAGNSSTLQNLTSTFTAEAWVYPTSLGGAERGILGKLNDNGVDRRQWMVIFDASSQPTFYGSPNGTHGSSDVLRGTALTVNKWYHVVVTISGNQWKIYVNGTLDVSKTASFSTFYTNTQDNFNIGRLASADRYLNGVIDEARVYNRTLSATEVLEHYRGKYNDNSGMVGYWALDENTGQTAYDGSGNGNNGTLGSTGGADDNDPTWVNYAPTWTTGKNGTALSFDGSDDYVRVSHSASLIPTIAVTAEAWIKPNTGYGESSPRIIEKDDGKPVRIAIQASTGILSNQIYIGGVARVYYANTVISTNVWTHVTVSFDGITHRIYLNGKIDDEDSTYSGAIGTASGPVFIGDTSDQTRNFNGLIDDVRIYDYARTEDEIRLDYNGGFAAHFGPSSSCDDDPGACMDYGLVGNWGFDEGSGTTAYDASDYANNGTLYNSPKWATGIKPLSGGASGGGALQFDGVNDYVNAGTNTILKPTLLSVEFWMNRDGVCSSDYPYVLSLWRSGIMVYLHNPAKQHQINVEYNLTANGVKYISWNSYQTPVNEWHHYIFTWDGTNAKTYRDGVLQTTGTSYAGDTINYAGEAHTGLIISRNGNLNGKLDEVRIYSRALSATEVRYHYNRGGPVGYWKFDEGSGTTAYDSSNNNNDGTLGGGTADYRPTWTTGKNGNALSFDGSNDYVYQSVSDFRSSDSAGTIEAWIKTTNTGNQKIFSSSDEASDSRWLGFWVQANGVFYVYQRNNDTEDNLYTGSTNALNGNWHHAVLTSDGSIYSIYIDGVVQSLSVLNGSNSGDWFADTANRDNWTIGILKRSSGIVTPFNGLIDDVRIYNYARTQDEIALDYNAGFAAHFGPSSSCDDDPGACMDYGLVGNWGFDEGSGTTAYDKSDYANNGTLYSSPKWVTGKVGGALQFDGKDDALDTPHNSSLNCANAITLEAWIKPTVLDPTNIQGIIIKWGDSGEWTWHQEYMLRIPNNTNNILFYLTIGSFVDMEVAGVVDWGVWQHFVATYDRNYMRIYKNGVEIGTPVADNDLISTADGDLTIGNHESSPGNYDMPFHGFIDDVRIYNRALSTTEIRYHYNRGGPVGYWKFDEGVGSTAYDETNNSNDGSLTNMESSDWVAGKVNSALDFDGSNEYVSITDPGTNSVLDITGAITLEAWAKSDTVYGGNQGSLIDKYQAYFLAMRDISGTLYAKMDLYQGGWMNPEFWGITPLKLGQWYHVVGVWDGSTARLYVNGVLDKSQSYSGTINANSNAVTIGTHSTTLYPFNGLIDDVRVYNYARTTEQIYQDYNAGLSTHFK